MNLTIKELRTLRRVVAEEINNQRQWAEMPRDLDRGGSVENKEELEHILALIDGEIVNKSFIKGVQREESSDSPVRGTGLDDVPVSGTAGGA